MSSNARAAEPRQAVTLAATAAALIFGSCVMLVVTLGQLIA